jgi:hypothetical protein
VKISSVSTGGESESTTDEDAGVVGECIGVAADMVSKRMHTGCEAKTRRQSRHDTLNARILETRAGSNSSEMCNP